MAKKLPKTTGDYFMMKFHGFSLLLTPSEFKKAWQRYNREENKGKLMLKKVM